VEFPRDPPVIAVELVLEPPWLDDLHADTTRLQARLAKAGMAGTAISLQMVGACSSRPSAQQWWGIRSLREHRRSCDATDQERDYPS
jgi:hypothetical protein